MSDIREPAVCSCRFVTTQFNAQQMMAIDRRPRKFVGSALPG